jgi:hypothetical protein
MAAGAWSEMLLSCNQKPAVRWVRVPGRDLLLTPTLPPHSTNTNGGGEYNIFMNIRIHAQIQKSSRNCCMEVELVKAHGRTSAGNSQDEMPGRYAGYQLLTAGASKRYNSSSACAGVIDRTNPHSPSRVFRDCFRIIWSLSFIGRPFCPW